MNNSRDKLVFTFEAHDLKWYFVPLVESGICLLVDVATLSTIYDVRHPLLLPPGYPTQELISRSDSLLLPPPGCPKREKKKKYATNFPPFLLDVLTPLSDCRHETVEKIMERRISRVSYMCWMDFHDTFLCCGFLCA